MSTPDAVAVVLWLGVTFYAVFAGADFGAGLWDLVADRGELGEEARTTIARAIGVVWEANHVWLVFVLVVLWTAFSAAFGAIMSTLFVPLSLVALGIVLRGAGFAFKGVARRTGARLWADRIFGLASLLTPFFMGTVVGAVAAGRVPPGNAQGDAVTSWLSLVGLITGALFQATSAYLAAVFLAHDARRFEEPRMVSYFRARALVAALPLVIVSLALGLVAIALIHRGAGRGTRPVAVGAVIAMVWAWGVAQYPYLLPTSLTIESGAGVDATLKLVLAVFVVAILLVLPSLGLLYALAQRDLVEEEPAPKL
jgi:cytochrome bd ubiquinol oxidase subunit II